MCLVVLSKDVRLQIAYIGGSYASYRILKLLVSLLYLCLHQSGEVLARRGLSKYLTKVTQRLALAFANRLYPQELYINSALYINITIQQSNYTCLLIRDRHRVTSCTPFLRHVLQIT